MNGVLRPGMMVTVLPGEWVEGAWGSYDSAGTWPGCVLEVLTVDPPFVVVRYLCASDGEPGPERPLALHMEKLRFKPLSEAYVQTLVPRGS